MREGNVSIGSSTVTDHTSVRNKWNVGCVSLLLFRLNFIFYFFKWFLVSHELYFYDKVFLAKEQIGRKMVKSVAVNDNGARRRRIQCEILVMYFFLLQRVMNRGSLVFSLNFGSQHVALIREELDFLGAGSCSLNY